MKRGLPAVFYFDLAPLLATEPTTAMPESAKEKLRVILLHEEFQPRRTGQSAVEQLREYILHWIQKILEWFRELFSLTPGASQELNPWFEKVLQVFEYGLWLFGAGIVGVLVYFLVKKIAKVFFQSSYLNTQVEPVAEPELLLSARESLEKLFFEGRFRELLSEVRLRLRHEFITRYEYSPALTDREVQCRVPKDDARRGVFEQVSQLFEQVAFAGRPIAATDVEAMYRLYEQEQTSV